MKMLSSTSMLITLFVGPEFNATLWDVLALGIASIGILGLVFRRAAPVAWLLDALLTASLGIREITRKIASRARHALHA